MTVKRTLVESIAHLPGEVQRMVLNEACRGWIRGSMPPPLSDWLPRRWDFGEPKQMLFETCPHCGSAEGTDHIMEPGTFPWQQQFNEELQALEREGETGNRAKKRTTA